MWLAAAIPAGRARRIRDAVVDKETESIRAGENCRSNDFHVIALARVSGARLLFTNDRTLEQDFKDRSLVPDPRGKIYKTTGRESRASRSAPLSARMETNVSYSLFSLDSPMTFLKSDAR